MMRYLGNEGIAKVQKDVPEAQRMRSAASIDDAITSTSTGKIQERGLVDAQILPE